jgi:hypothetical protein
VNLRIREQVDPDLPQQRRITLTGWQFPNRDLDLPPLSLAAQAVERLADEAGGVNRLLVEWLTAQPRKSQQIINQTSHLLGVLADDPQVTSRLGRELGRIVFQQNARKAIHGLQRRAQVVRDGAGEGFHLLDGGFQLCGALNDALFKVLVEFADLLLCLLALSDVESR